MLEYLINHKEEFSSILIPFSTIQMQLTASFITELINLSLICSQNTVMDAVINFIALGAITEIDDYYAKSIIVKWDLNKA